MNDVKKEIEIPDFLRAKMTEPMSKEPDNKELTELIIDETNKIQLQATEDNLRHLRALKEHAENMTKEEQEYTAMGLDMGVMCDVLKRKSAVLNDMYKKVKNTIEVTEFES